MKEKILIVDDEHDIIKLITDTLRKEEYVVSSASSVTEAHRKVAQSIPDLILLDLRLPVVDGFEYCKMLKKDEKTENIPIIMLTSKSLESDKVVGLELGADDYITKPFSPAELRARIKAVLRRLHPAEKQLEVIESGDLSIKMSERTAYIKGKPIELRPKEFDLLCLLIKKKGTVLTREFIMESVWSSEYFGTSRTVDVHINRLIKKIKYLEKRIISVTGYGYRYIENI
ncbi:MAG: hypothetical protein A2252_02370 [Elusimicrobia bacterium RIFOXYA2_FULL_39_19]|nr:MAG: hypothetical protein A2252_02370 [Elusimicrobia bacterium RIFOXYA2_FULL_39_19]